MTVSFTCPACGWHGAMHLDVGEAIVHTCPARLSW